MYLINDLNNDFFRTVDIGNGKSSKRRTGSSGWGSVFRSRSTPRPRISQTSNQGNFYGYLIFKCIYKLFFFLSFHTEMHI